MVKTHKIALSVNNERATLLSRHCGFARVAYNYAQQLMCQHLDETGKILRLAALKRAFNKVKYDEYEWCKALSQNAGKNAIHDLDAGIDKWLNPELPNRKPKKRKRSHGQSYRADNGPDTVIVDGRRVKLPKIGWLKMREILRFDGSIRTATIVKEAGRWFVCLSVKVAESLPPKRKMGRVIGIDVGVKTLAVTSEGEFIENPKALATHRKKLRKVDKAIARSRNVHGKNKRSKRRDKQYLQRQKLHARIRNIRDDLQHKATSAIGNAKHVREVVVETLQIKGMLKNRKLSRAIADASMSKFIDKLKYKCEWSGIDFKRADTFFPSTKTCSSCGNKKAHIGLDIRTYTCYTCGLVMDRDLNAAINLSQYQTRLA